MQRETGTVRAIKAMAGALCNAKFQYLLYCSLSHPTSSMTVSSVTISDMWPLLPLDTSLGALGCQELLP